MPFYLGNNLCKSMGLSFGSFWPFRLLWLYWIEVEIRADCFATNIDSLELFLSPTYTLCSITRMRWLMWVFSLSLMLLKSLNSMCWTSAVNWLRLWIGITWNGVAMLFCWWKTFWRWRSLVLKKHTWINGLDEIVWCSTMETSMGKEDFEQSY